MTSTFSLIFSFEWAVLWSIARLDLVVSLGKFFYSIGFKFSGSWIVTFDCYHWVSASISEWQGNWSRNYVLYGITVIEETYSFVFSRKSMKPEKYVSCGEIINNSVNVDDFCIFESTTRLWVKIRLHITI